jgi:hypothetical protein
LATEDPAFAEVLAALRTQDELARLVQLVSFVQGAGGRAALDAAVADGTLRQVLALPDAAVTLVRDSGSLQAGAGRGTPSLGSRLERGRGAGECTST